MMPLQQQATSALSGSPPRQTGLNRLLIKLLTSC